MKKINYILVGLVLSIMLFLAACGSTPTSTPKATVTVEQPTQVIPTVMKTAEPTATFQTHAPACPVVACTMPAFSDLQAPNTYCVQKIPYQNISLPLDITYEVLDTSGEFKCSDSGTVLNGKSVISCTGKQLWTYELKLINKACVGANLSTGSMQCDNGFGYDLPNNCCAPLEGAANATKIIKVNIGACQ